LEKKRIVKDYDKLSEDVIAKVKKAYPRGYVAHLINYTDINGNRVSALPFETEEFYYLIRMTIQEARQIIKDDEDYDEHGNLREDFGSTELPDDDILSDVDMEIVEAAEPEEDIDDMNDMDDLDDFDEEEEEDFDDSFDDSDFDDEEEEADRKDKDDEPEEDDLEKYY